MLQWLPVEIIVTLIVPDLESIYELACTSLDLYKICNDSYVRKNFLLAKGAAYSIIRGNDVEMVYMIDQITDNVIRDVLLAGSLNGARWLHVNGFQFPECDFSKNRRLAVYDSLFWGTMSGNVSLVHYLFEIGLRPRGPLHDNKLISNPMMAYLTKKRCMGRA